ncbi:ABC transporter permease [Parvularcula sp. IMCC14364]|uniref:ABC transporter permease n=1 Tax=Parvularcula sp. IMCC14364 TaxID=3067902 RepID=UPI002741256F|nr:ABC transporter permease [Parvularcula sp. IMCC14364]
MITGIMRVMALRLLRDRGALVLAFLLPPMIFAIFAAIFSNATNGDLDLDVAMAVTNDSARTKEVASAFAISGKFNVFTEEDWTRENVRQQVREGFADTGVIFSSDLADVAEATIEIVVEPSRDIAATVLAGQLQQFIAEEAPDLAIRRNALTVSTLAGGFTPEQDTRLDTALAALMQATERESTDGFYRQISALDETNRKTADPSIAYYAGATAILFLLFSLMQGATISLDERRNAITERLLLGPSGTLKLTFGKFLYLTLQGTAQALFIFVVAALLFEVPVIANALPLFLVSVAMASCAAGLALFVTSLCSTATQAHTVQTFLVLIFSSVGGSMVPRFMMPEWLQSLGFFTPNAWAIEAVYGVLARGDTITGISTACAILIVTGLLSFIASAAVSYQMMRS